MAREIASFAEGSPLESHIGNLDDTRSFLSVFYNTSNVTAKYSIKYRHDIIDYCVEWEVIVSTRVDKEADDTKKLREMFNHYHDKVDALRKKVNVQEIKGKSANNSLVEKLQRNEEKLDEASELYESSALPLCVLIEEVVQYGYKDLYPLILATMKFEMEHSQHEARTFHLFQNEEFEKEFREEMGIGHRRVQSSGKGKSSHKKISDPKIDKGEVSPSANHNLKRNKSSSIPGKTTTKLVPTKEQQVQPVNVIKKDCINFDSVSCSDDSSVANDENDLDSRKVDAV
jgi:hypothetical protein